MFQHFRDCCSRRTKQSESHQSDFQAEVALDYNVFLKEQLAIKVHVKALNYEVCLRFELIKSDNKY